LHCPAVIAVEKIADERRGRETPDLAEQAQDNLIEGENAQNIQEAT
jgi:hypothetical protein